MSNSPTDLAEDPRCKPGAYLAHNGRLYEACYIQSTVNSGVGGLGKRRIIHGLRVTDACTDEQAWLDAEQIQAAVLVRAAPVVEDSPADLAELRL